MMNNDLFGGSAELERLPMQDAEVWFASKIELPDPADEILHRLIDGVPWRAEQVTVWGKKYDQPRLIAWFGDPGKAYTYSGIAMTPLPWTQELRALKSVVESFANESFNSVLLNYYRDGRDNMGFHSDNERELGPTPTIASLSLGNERTFVFKHKTAKSIKAVRLKLTSESLLVMKGETQANWKHGIDKEILPCGPRVNLTFRRIFNSR
jgi:alkylated DNA repair dioxygenase AlkB